MKATDLLKQQHRDIERLFQRIEKAADDSEKRVLLDELATNIVGHMVIEEQIFYPAARLALEQNTQIEQSYEEHMMCKLSLERALASGRQEESFAARLAVLKELIESHIDEEESSLFPKAEKALGRDQLDQLAQKMKPAFEEACEEGYKRVLPRLISGKTTRRATNGRSSPRRNGRRTSKRHSARQSV